VGEYFAKHNRSLALYPLSFVARSGREGDKQPPDGGGADLLAPSQGMSGEEGQAPSLVWEGPITELPARIKKARNASLKV
jgi:hypothetical protein